MAIVSAEVRFAPQLTAWFTANPTKVLQDGEIVYCSDGANIGKYVIGDNSTQLSSLVFYGGISSSGLTIGTTTITSGTNTRILYNNNGVVGEYTVTGTGTTAVLSTSPTFTTSALVNGYLDLGTIATPTLANGRFYYNQGTDGFVFYTNDATNSEYHTQWKNASAAIGVYLANAGGNPAQIGTTTNHSFSLIVNGGLPKIRIETNGNVGINSSTDPGCAFGVTGTTNLNGATLTGRILDIKQDTAFVAIGSLTSDTSTSAIYMNQATPSGTNYTLRGSSSTSYLNGLSSITFNIGGSQYGRIRNSDWNFSNGSAGAGSAVQFLFTNASNTNQTLSTNIPNFKVTGATTQWATGALATQYFNYFSANTVAFVGASTATNVYGLYVEAATAGANATITNNYAAGFGGNVNIIGTPHVSGVAGVDGTFTTVDGKTVTVSKGLITAIV